MTVTANTTRNDYTAGSAQSEYDYTFQLNEAADVDVYLDGVKQTLNTHYVVQNVGNASGGTIVFTLEDENGDPIDPTEGAIINIVMAMGLDRDTNYQPSGAFLAADVNNDFDRLWLATNQQQTAVNRALRLKDTDVTTSSMELPLKDDRKGKLLAFNATTGDPEATTNNQSNWDTAYNNSITSASFSGSTLTLGQQDGGTITASHTPYLPIAGGTLTGDLRFNDNDELRFGDSNDLRIYHTGTSSIIQDTGTGDLALLGTNLAFANGAGTSYYAAGTEGGAFALYYNGSEKLATTSGGISVTGTITATGYNDSNWNTAYNNMITAVDFSNSTLTLTQQDGGTLTTTINGNIGQWTTSGSNIYYNSGNVGIGTSSPSNPFHAYHATTNIVGLLESGDTTCGIDLKDSAATGRIATVSGKLSLQADIGAEGADSRIDFKVDGSEKMRIDSSGNLLVGTTSANPQSRASGEGVQLSPDFIGVGRFQNPALYLNRQNNDGDVAVFRKDGTTVGSIGTVNGDIYLGTGNVNLRFTDSANDIRPVNSSGVNLDNTVDLGASATRFKDLYLSGGVKGTNLTFSGNGSSEHAKIDSSGRVGIGTSSPASKLHVSSTDSVSITQTHTDGNTVSFKQSGTGGDVEWRNGNGEALIMTGSQTRMTVDSSGNVGIGTSNPAALLHLESASAPTLKIDDSDSVLALELAQDGADGSMLLGSAGVLTIGVTNNSSSDTVAFQTKSTERMRIDSSGRLALGTTTAGAKFHAVDGGAVTGILESTGALGSILSFKDSNTASLTAAAIGCLGNEMAIFTGSSAQGVERVRVDVDGNVGIGTSSPAANLHVDASAPEFRLSQSGTAKVRLRTTGDSFYCARC
jgi:hypothetical protein